MCSPLLLPDYFAQRVAKTRTRLFYIHMFWAICISLKYELITVCWRACDAWVCVCCACTAFGQLNGATLQNSAQHSWIACLNQAEMLTLPPLTSDPTGKAQGRTKPSNFTWCQLHPRNIQPLRSSLTKHSPTSSWIKSNVWKTGSSTRNILLMSRK